MLIFHFCLDDERPAAGRAGTWVRDAEQAKREAVRFAGECLRDNPDLLWPPRLRFFRARLR